MEISELINRISLIRTRANLSARKLSLMIGKGESYIHRMESTIGTEYQFAPAFESLMEILEACNITPEEFFYYDINTYKTDKEIIEQIKTASPDRKAAALSILKLK